VGCKFWDVVNLDAIGHSVKRTVPALSTTRDHKRCGFGDRSVECYLRAINAWKGL
jgi:hypothetical protein